MSEDLANAAFVVMASAHVDLANAHAAAHPRELAAAAILHAAARYNAFTGTHLARTAEELAILRDELIAEQVAQFRDALTHHYQGYVAELGAKAG